MKMKFSLSLFKKAFSFFTVSDIVLTIVIMALAIFLLINNLKKDNQTVRINYQNELWGEYQLSEKRIIKISEEIEVEIADNKVRMLKNNCPNQLCVEQGWTSSFPIICVPNQVEILIIANKNNNEIRHILK